MLDTILSKIPSEYHEMLGYFFLVCSIFIGISLIKKIIWALTLSSLFLFCAFTLLGVDMGDFPAYIYNVSGTLKSTLLDLLNSLLSMFNKK